MQRPALAALAAILAFAPVARGGDSASDAAGRDAFQTGVALLADPDGARYEEALANFRRAYELLGNWKVLGNLALCQLKLERDGEAIASYTTYLARGGADIDPAERAQIESDVRVIRAQGVRARLEVPGPGYTVVDDRVDARGVHTRNEYVAAAGPLELVLRPGRHVLATKGPAPTEPWDVALPPGSVVDHRFVAFAASSASAPFPLAPAAPSAAPSAPPAAEPAYAPRTLGWVTLGAGGALAAFGGVGFLLAHQAAAEATEHCADDVQLCDATGVSAGRRTHTWNTLGAVGLGLGAVGLGVGTWMLVRSPDGATAFTGPAVVAGGGTWSVSGRF